ncbi:MAG: hypothetical protein R2745_06930 [Vicinamibacterales bacterium]
MIACRVEARLVAVVALVALATNAGAEPSTASSMPWKVGRPDAMAVSGTTVYMASRGDLIPRTKALGGFGVFGAAEAVADPVPATNGAVAAIIADGAGGWYIGGTFTTVGGVPRAGLARVRADGSVDSTFVCNVAGSVNALALNGANLIVGGVFTTLNLVPRASLGVISATTGLVLSAAPSVTGGAVNALLLSGPTLYVGGAFTMAGGQPRIGMAAFTLATGAIVAGFTANVSSGHAVLALAQSGSSLFLGGTMLTVNGVARPKLAKVSLATGFVDASWNGLVDDAVTTLAVDGNAVVAGGTFTTAGGQPRSRLAALDAATGAATAWRADTDGDVNRLRVAGGVAYVVGTFDMVSGQRRQGAAAITAAAPATVLPWQPSLARSVVTLEVAGGRVAVGGTVLQGWGAAARGNLAAIDLLTGDVLPWAPKVTGGVTSMVAAGSRLVVSGVFTAIDGVNRKNVAAFDLTTHALLPLSLTLDGPVWALAAIGDTLFLAGDFTVVNGAFRIRLAAIDLATGALLSWDPQADLTPYFLMARGDRVLVGGYFTSLIGTNGFQVRQGLGEITTGGAVTAFDVGATYGGSTGYIGAAAIAGSRMLVSGDFTALQGAPRQGLAAVDATTGAVLPWATAVSTPPGQLSARGNDVYLAGLFTSVGGQPRNGFAKVDATTGAVSPWVPSQVPLSGQFVLTTEFGVLFVGDVLLADRLAFYPEQALGGPPGPPVQVNARTVGGVLTMSWLPPIIGPRPSAYVLEVGTGPGLANVGTLALASTSFTIGGVPPTTFYARVRGVNGAGAGAASRDVAFTAGAPSCTAAPEAPSKPSTVVAGNTVIVSWAGEPGSAPASYTLQAGTSSGLANIGAIPIGAATSFSTGGVPPGAYFVRVVGANTCGPSPASADGVLAVGGAAGPPGAPINLTTTTAPGSVSLSWTTSAAGGAPAGHLLEAGTGPGLSNLAVVPIGPATSFSVGGVPPGTYYLRIRAVNGSGSSATSGLAVAVVP